MTPGLNGYDPHDDAGLPIGRVTAPRRAGDPAEDDWTEQRRERRSSWREAPPPPAPPSAPSWLTPSTLFSGLALILAVAAPLIGIYPRLTAVETRLQAQSELISDMRQQINGLGSVDVRIAELHGQLSTLTGRLDAQRQTLTAIESALMERADRPRQLPLSGR